MTDIKKIHYMVLLGFDVADKKITLNEYIKKINAKKLNGENINL